MQKYLKQKIRLYAKSSTNIDFQVFLKWLKNNSREDKYQEITNSSEVESFFIDNFNKIKKEEEAKKRENEILEELEMLFVENENKHIGTIKLSLFYKKFNINYKTEYYQRQKHQNRIGKIRKKLIKKGQGRLEYYLISGIAMKKLLKLDYSLSNFRTDYEKIDGWCYTKKEDWLEKYFSYEIKKIWGTNRSLWIFQK